MLSRNLNFKGRHPELVEGSDALSKKHFAGDDGKKYFFSVFQLLCIGNPRLIPRQARDDGSF